MQDKIAQNSLREKMNLFLKEKINLHLPYIGRRKEKITEKA